MYATKAPVFWARYYRPPFIGILAFFGVVLATPLAHSFTVLTLAAFPEGDSAWVFLFTGAIALLMLVYATRSTNEVTATLLGFASGTLMWVGWASYAFKFNEITLSLPMVDIGDGSWRPIHLLFIQGSIGICIGTLLFFVFNKDTRCNAFRWIQRICRLNLGEPDSGQGRNFGRITFLETIYVTWFCYAASLFLGDSRYLGYHHPLTYGIVGALAVWGCYLLWRLMKYTRVMAGIRYAIPTKSIFWIPFGEFGPRWGLYDDVWLKPAEYSTTMWTILSICAVLLIASGFLPQRRQSI